MVDKLVKTHSTYPVLKQIILGLIDDRNEKIGKKIRDAELKKVPFMLIVGEKEAETEAVSVRQRGVGDHGSMNLDNFAALIQEAIAAELA